MNKPKDDQNMFEVFLCHSSEDKPKVNEIANQLAKNGITSCLGIDQIQPGTSWQVALGEQINRIKSAIVFVGESGICPWQDQEIQALLSQLVKRKCRFIPVVLPSVKKLPELPWILQNLRWVDFRSANPDPLKQLIWGITGKKMDEQSNGSSCLGHDTPQENDLFPPLGKRVVELRLNMDEFSDKDKMEFFKSLNKLIDVGEVKLTKVVAGSVRLYLELDSEAADKLYSADKEGRLANLGVMEARLYPAIANPPDAEQRSQLLSFLDRVGKYWIEGVLDHSLYNEMLSSLGKRATEEAVEPPWKHYVEFPSQRRHLNLQDRSIMSVFDTTGLLLILGKPGSGKTTTLLGLASGLIERVKDDHKERVPVVLNLSSWKKKKSLAGWIVEELFKKYRIPTKIGRVWLENDYLLPMLDGLDEVRNANQPSCGAAINDFIEKFRPSGLVVCCSLMAYEWLPERLKFNGAICLELMDPEEVNEFLAIGGSQLEGLKEVLSVDQGLRELSRTPLMLIVMCLAFEGFGRNDFVKKKLISHKEQRRQIFNLYVERMFQRKKSFTNFFFNDSVVGWLSLLAKGMKEHSQSVFMVENLQPSWLGTKVQRVLYGILTALVIAIVYGSIVGLIVGLRGSSSAGLSLGLLFGLIILFGVGFGCWPESKVGCGYLCTTISGSIWSLTGWLSVGLILGLIDAMIGGLIVGLIVGLIGGVGVGSLKVISSVETLRWRWKKIWRNAIPGFIIGLIVGLSAGTVSGLLGIMTDTYGVDKVSPNQGIKLSLKNAMISTLIIGLIVGLSVGLIYGLIWGLSTGSFFGLIGGLNRGGSAVIKHYCLRVILWIMGYTPLKFIKFLEYCSKLILLKKVGGGYMFMHRMFLEHFAENDLMSRNTKISN